MTFPSKTDDYQKLFLRELKKLIIYVRQNNWIGQVFYKEEKLKELYEADLTPILHCSRNDFIHFIDDEYSFFVNTNSVVYAINEYLYAKKHDTDLPDENRNFLRAFLDTAVATKSHLWSYYDSANAITFLVPSGRFNTEMPDYVKFQSLLDRLEALKIDTVYINVSDFADTYIPEYIKITNTHHICQAYTGKTDAPVFEAVTNKSTDYVYLNTQNAPSLDNVERGKHSLWVMSFCDITNSDTATYKQVWLHSSYPDIINKKTSMSKISLRLPTQTPGDLMGFCKAVNPDVLPEKIMNDDNIRWFILDGNEGEHCPFVRLPASWILTTREKYLLSCSYQTIETFLDRKRIYKKEADNPHSPHYDKDIVIIDEEDANKDTDEPLIRTLSDIVLYEENNGTVFKTHHASPRRHYVRPFDRYLSKSGKTVPVQGHWRGKDNKEIIYKLPKRKRNKK